MNLGFQYLGIASGTINPATFVKGDTSNPNQYLQAGAGSIPLAITPNASKYVPGTPGISSFPYAETNDPVYGYYAEQMCELTCGTAWTPYQFLAPDASGNGKPAGIGDWVGALSMTSAAANEITRVMSLQPFVLGNGNASAVNSVSANTLATAANAGQLIVVTAADKTVTLPLGTPGMKFFVLASGTGATGGSVGTTVAMNAADSLAGNGFTAAAGKGAVNTHGTAVDGDFIEVECVAANSWYIIRIKGT